jgi:hypothetical protein
MTIPWSSLGSGKMEISVDGAEMIVREVHPQLWEGGKYRTAEWAKQQIQSFCEAIINDFAKKASPGNDRYGFGYLGAIIMRIISNIQVVANDIHIRFEDEVTNCFAFGVTLEEMKICTVNKCYD